MENEICLTKLASCAGCGAKVGAGTLASLLNGFRTHTDPNLLVGYDRSDDASVYRLDGERALIQTVDFFPPIVDDPYTFGQIAAANAMSDIYAMGGEPRLCLNLLCVTESMDDHTVREILRGGYDKAYEAGAIVTGGHTIHGAEPVYGMSVTGFAHPDRIFTNSGAKPGDALILTKPLGAGILTTGAKAGLVPDNTIARLCRYMTALNKAARDVLVNFPVHACTDVTGFSLMGHGLEMAQGSGCTLCFDVNAVPFHPEAEELADMGFIPAGAYRNRNYVNSHYAIRGQLPLAREDILFDPQTSGGLLVAVDGDAAEECLAELKKSVPDAALVGCVTKKQETDLILEF